MKIDKIKVVYKLPAPFPFKDLKDYHNKNGVWFFDDFLERFEGSYNIIEKQLLHITQMRKINSWRDYYKFGTEDEEGTVSFFMNRLRGIDDLDGSVCMIEFNPNKARIPHVLLAYLNMHSAYVHRISSMDVAFDLKDVPIQNICFVGHGATSTMTIGTIGSAATRYLRPNCKDGRIKVYDKEKERKGHKDEADYKNVTRVEITYQNVEFLLLDFLKQKMHDIPGNDPRSIDEMLQREIYEPYEKAFYECFKRVSQMLKYLDGVRIFDAFKGSTAEQFGLKQYQLDMFDAYIEKFGFQNLNILYNQMSYTTAAKYRAYAKYLSNVQTRPLFKGCASDYFFALRQLVLNCIPCPRVDEDAIINFHRFNNEELPF
ncbi:MAG: hypothetical protein IJY94_02380 [Clostridia bacterium]|nr:hypothetical protein [Clostridia bacterium]